MGLYYKGITSRRKTPRAFWSAGESPERLWRTLWGYPSVSPGAHALKSRNSESYNVQPREKYKISFNLKRKQKS